ncbi:Peptidoglycan/xylan/chitin deacetylase, PgdA/CDA1 family [Flavobacterium segetis]|uniref:Peptidoglycan/xylan/chitin deacetylase, PgdA/CDA1 family n=1 Tax=Flavobacterium segetis TaxID=271157 RepID=A0A1M5F1B2_9FLAO|nr:polysaccharide deacetylase family protein [Flavobacterium segetis]SHF85289.1 Peptidoglycan/xylan/chitin deacetylase, PgdA/CDA1 family [Flavobacterium segetis]
MKLYWIKTHWIVKKLFHNYIWDVSNENKTVYLTFDDGPIPGVTPWVINQLEKYNVKATFFCIGDNIYKHPELFEELIADGHSIGNHTFNHLDAWKTQKFEYLDNIKKCEEIIFLNSKTANKSKIFRPPYGKIKRSQSKAIRNLGYKIVMWDILSADFDQKISKEECLANVLLNIESGSIIVFHDSIKAFRNLEYVLPRTLDYLKNNNYNCKVL